MKAITGNTTLEEQQSLQTMFPAAHHRSEISKIIYCWWGSIIVLSILPLVLLLFLNGAIVCNIYGSARNRTKITNTKNRYATKTTQILFAVVTLFCICHSARICQRLLFYLDHEDTLLWLTITPIYQLAEIFTSATNFLIYCIVGGKFRKELYGLFEKKKKRQNIVLVYTLPCN